MSRSHGPSPMKRREIGREAETTVGVNRILNPFLYLGEQGLGQQRQTSFVAETLCIVGEIVGSVNNLLAHNSEAALTHSLNVYIY